MKVFIAGATGAIGQALVPQLLADGHDVVGLARSGQRARELAGLGAQLVTGDALDRPRLVRLVADAAPEAIVNLLTAIPATIDPRHIDRDMAATNRLRTEGTRNLFDAGRRAGVRRHVVESIAYVIDPSQPAVTDEAAPVWDRPPKRYAAAVAAVGELERLSDDDGATVLRFGHLYGPGTAFAPDGSFTAQVRAGKVPLVGQAGSTFSFVHCADAAEAISAALTSEQSGTFNVVDDDPAPIREWLPELADILGAPAPKHVPAWLARAAVGRYGVAFLTELRGSSNRRAKEVLGWQPSRPSWRQGFREAVDQPQRPAAPQKSP